MNPDDPAYFSVGCPTCGDELAVKLYALAQFVTLLELLKEDSDAWCWRCRNYIGHNGTCWSCYESRPGLDTGEGDWE